MQHKRLTMMKLTITYQYICHPIIAKLIKTPITVISVLLPYMNSQAGAIS